MDLLRLHFIGTLLCTAAVAAAVQAGFCPHAAVSETAPVTVRDNPASYRPSYVGSTGFRPIPTGGGSGGGWSSGK